MIILFGILISVFNLSKGSEKCRVLVMEGGGDRGAYLAGAFKRMTEIMPPEECAYDIITGISAGGMNSGAISTYEKGNEKEAAEFLN